MSTCDFERYLVERFSLPPDAAAFESEWQGTGNTIGALALRLGLLDLHQIDRILSLQEDDRRLFGELAVHLGFLSADEVERLVSLQRLHQFLEVGENIVVRGHLSMEDLQRALLDFASTSRGIAADASAEHSSLAEAHHG